MKTLTELVQELLSDRKWHTSKEILDYACTASGKTRGNVKVALHNLVARNHIKRQRFGDTDNDCQYRLLEASGYGVSEKLALLDQHLRKAREANATT